MFQVIGEIAHRKTIAVGSAIHEIARLRKVYGRGRWRKMKGDARICLTDGTIRAAEVHWYEAHGYGRKELKLKRFLDQP